MTKNTVKFLVDIKFLVFRFEKMLYFFDKDCNNSQIYRIYVFTEIYYKTYENVLNILHYLTPPDTIKFINAKKYF